MRHIRHKIITHTLNTRNLSTVISQHQNVLITQRRNTHIQDQCLALTAVNLKATLHKNTAMTHRANHIRQLIRRHRMATHQTHRISTRRSLNHAAHLINHQVGATNHSKHLSGTITQRRRRHQATLLLPLTTRHRVHAQDAHQQTYHARNKGDQTGIHVLPFYSSTPLSINVADTQRSGERASSQTDFRPTLRAETWQRTQ